MPTPIIPDSVLDSGNVLVQCFGRRYGDWSMRNLLSQADLARDPERETFHKLSQVAKQVGCKKVYIPSTNKFNAKMCHPEDLTDNITLPEEIILHRSQLIFADGIKVGKDFGVFFRSGDCPTVVLNNMRSGRTIATHAGRDCLLDKGCFSPTGSTRKNFSVIESALETLGHIHSREVTAVIVCGIKSHFDHNWSHPTYGEINEKRTKYVIKKWGRACISGDIKYGILNLDTLIRAQLAEAGVSEENITSDEVDTYSDRNEHGEYRWHSQHREDTSRNGIFITRH